MYLLFQSRWESDSVWVWDKTVKVWNAKTGDVVQTLEGPSDGVSSVCFNHDGSQIASGSWDKTVKVWNAKTGDLVQTLEGHSDSVSSVCFNHDGSQIASGSDDKTVKVLSAHATDSLLKTKPLLIYQLHAWS